MQDFEFGSRTFIMGILNVTPDSFSGDGVYRDIASALKQAELMISQGADIIDVGGESTRPGSESVPVEEEIKRVVPVIKELTKKFKVPVSIDTQKSEVAHRALDNGASIVNDISGLDHDKKMAGIAGRYKAKVVIMHMKGEPLSMQKNPTYESVVDEIINRLKFLIHQAVERGVDKKDIIIDPGIGFGKTFEHNLEILKNLGQFKKLEQPILIGTSRKSFIGEVLGVEPKDRIFGTAASVAIAIKNGADIIRVHDVKEMREVAKVVDAITRERKTHLTKF
ncbi:MAG: dihydropteroate synthase [Candidatus Omnitrophota bacterium]|jgi:dihydropteroate synthase|nr:dihydropteroate synthase [Candidatus Omnitrophota bacterium]